MKKFKCDLCGEDDPCFLETDGNSVPAPFACPFDSDYGGESCFASDEWIEIKEEPTNDRD